MLSLAEIAISACRDVIIFFQNDNVISQQSDIPKDALSPLFTAQNRGMLFTTLTALHNC